MKRFILTICLIVINSSVWGSELLDAYHKIQTALAQDAFPEVKDQAGKMITPINAWLKEAEMLHVQRPDVNRMLEGATKLALNEVEAEQRLAFGTLSEGAVGFIRKDKPLQASYQLFFCPMVSTYAYWVQPKGEKIANPYMGTSMPMCGSKKPW